MQSEISADSLRDVYNFVKGNREYQAIFAVMGAVLAVGLASIALKRLRIKNTGRPAGSGAPAPAAKTTLSAAEEALLREYAAGEAGAGGRKTSEIILMAVFVALLFTVVYALLKS